MTRPRILVTCYPQSGHLHPLIPIARALADAECPVVVATAADQHEALRRVNLDVVALGPSREHTGDRLPDIMPQILAAPASQRRAIAFSFVFGELYAPGVADDLLALGRLWRADAVLAGLESLAGPLVAAQLARPLIVSGFGIGLSTTVGAAASQAVASLWARADLSVPSMAGIFDGLFLDPCPESLHPEDVPVAPRRQPIRPAEFDGDGNLPLLPTQRPLVYVTFGTNPRFANPERLQMIARAIAAVGARAVITGFDPSQLPPLPDGIVAHRFIPQSRLLAQTDAVVCHGGASTVLGALANGVPLVLMPLGADHFANAGAAVARGVAVVVSEDVQQASMEAALARALTDAEMRRAAEAVSREISAMPTAAAAAEGILSWLAKQTAG
jgi:UDP:flavonoid glycosyltransferase YjiC (YdhE family)